MASVDEFLTGLLTYLKAYAGLTAIIDTRIYPHVLPETRVLPAVVYMVEATPQSRFSGTVYAEPYIRLSAWSYTHTLSWQAAEQIRLALEGYHGALGTVHAFCMIEGMNDGRYEPAPAPGLYPVHVYARFWFRET